MGFKSDPIQMRSWIPLLLALLTIAVFWQTVSFDFVKLDDDHYILNNPYVLDGLTARGLRWAFTTNYQCNWHPLTWISFMVDAEVTRWLTGAEADLLPSQASVYHLTNIILHIASALLLFWALCRMTGRPWRAAFVAALFAIHPLHVESVAWVTERKDVLSGVFFMLVLLAYTHYVRQPSIRRYALVAAAFALGLMSKSILVTLPVVLLLLDFWPFGRVSTFRSLFGAAIEKVPLFVLSGASAAATIWAQRSGGGLVGVEALPIGVRGANAAVACVAYLKKMVWPANLACLYPHPGDTLPEWQVAASAVIVAALTALALAARNRRPYLTVGWFWYLIVLLPVSRLLQVGRDAMADRYTYLPMIGILIAVAWWVGELVEQRPRWAARTAAAICLIVTAAFAAAAHKQTGFWRDSVTLFTHAIGVTERNSIAHNNLAVALMEQGDPEQAAYHLAKALEYHPEYAEAHFNLGTLLGMAGQSEQAKHHLREAVRLDPGHVRAHNNLGLVYMQEGKLELAAEQFRAALRIDPGLETARENLELVLSRMGATSPRH